MIKFDPLIKKVVGEAEADPVFRAMLVELNGFTVMHNGVLHLTDDAMECWYQHRESKAYAKHGER